MQLLRLLLCSRVRAGGESVYRRTCVRECVRLDGGESGQASGMVYWPHGNRTVRVHAVAGAAAVSMHQAFSGCRTATLLNQ